MLDHGQSPPAPWPPEPGAVPPPARTGPSPALRIGLLNNMPDAAFLGTERQFRRLIGAQADIRLFAFRTPLRGPAIGGHIEAHYARPEALSGAGLDALVVTGCEPRLARLEDEPFFAPLSAVIDWAALNTVSTLFSCLASHAAVLHLHGIRRRPLPAKHSGVYACGAAARHPLLSGIPDTVAVPHSRWNDLAETDLAAHGYTVLRRSGEVGVDLFVREARSLFVFLQGHPEYDPDSLAREYRRDVGRFLDGTRETLPDLPEHYFTAPAAARLEAFAARARGHRAPDLFPGFPALEDAPPRPPAWQAPAARLFRNWLGCVALRRGLALHREAV